MCWNARRRRGCAACARLRIGGETDLDALIDAQAMFLDLILSQQLADIHAGRPATNTVSVRRLSAAEREQSAKRLAGGPPP